MSFAWPEVGISVPFKKPLGTSGVVFQLDRGNENDFVQDRYSVIKFRESNSSSVIAFRKDGTRVAGGSYCRIDKRGTTEETTSGVLLHAEYEGAGVNRIFFDAVPHGVWVVFSNDVLGLGSIDGKTAMEYQSLSALIESGFDVGESDVQALKLLFGPAIVTHNFVAFADYGGWLSPGEDCVKGITPVMIFNDGKELLLIGSLSFG